MSGGGGSAVGSIAGEATAAAAAAAGIFGAAPRAPTAEDNAGISRGGGTSGSAAAAPAARLARPMGAGVGAGAGAGAGVGTDAGAAAAGTGVARGTNDRMENVADVGAAGAGVVDTAASAARPVRAGGMVSEPRPTPGAQGVPAANAENANGRAEDDAPPGVIKGTRARPAR